MSHTYIKQTVTEHLNQFKIIKNVLNLMINEMIDDRRRRHGNTEKSATCHPRGVRSTPPSQDHRPIAGQKTDHMITGLWTLAIGCMTVVIATAGHTKVVTPTKPGPGTVACWTEGRWIQGRWIQGRWIQGHMTAGIMRLGTMTTTLWMGVRKRWSDYRTRENGRQEIRRVSHTAA